MTESTPASTPASDLHPDVLALAQQLTDEVDKFVAGVESLDANNWLASADKIDALNQQLQGMLVESPPAKSTKSQKSS